MNFTRVSRARAGAVYISIRTIFRHPRYLSISRSSSSIPFLLPFARAGFEDVVLALAAAQFRLVLRRKLPAAFTDAGAPARAFRDMASRSISCSARTFAPSREGLEIFVADHPIVPRPPLQRAIDFGPLLAFDAALARPQIFLLEPRSQFAFDQFPAQFAHAALNVVAVQRQSLRPSSRTPRISK